MGSSTYTTVGVVEESSLGTTPSSALRLVNCSEGSLAMDRDSSRPEIWTGSQRRYPERPMREGATMTISAPQQYENMLEFYEGLFGAARANAVTVTGTGIAVGSSTTITDSGNGLGNFAVGDWVYVSGFSTAANNGWHGPVTTAAAGTLTFSAGGLTTESAGASISLKTRRLVEPATATLKTYSVEVNDTDLARFQSSKAMTVTNGQWNWQVGQFATEQFQLQGRLPAVAGSTIGTGTATAAKTSAFINTPTDWADLWYASTTASTAIFTQLQLQANPNVESIMGLGDLGPSSYSRGPLDWTLTGSLYYDTTADDFVDHALAHSTKWVAWSQADPAGNKMLFFLPSVKISLGNFERGAPNSQKTIPFTATAHSSAFDSSATFSGIANQAAVFFVPAS